MLWSRHCYRSKEKIHISAPTVYHSRDNLYCLHSRVSSKHNQRILAFFEECKHAVAATVVVKATINISNNYEEFDDSLKSSSSYFRVHISFKTFDWLSRRKNLKKIFRRFCRHGNTHRELILRSCSQRLVGCAHLEQEWDANASQYLCNKNSYIKVVTLVH